MKAKKLETYYDKWSNTVVYEYRGRKYEVEYSNSYQYCCTPAWYQHKIAQEKIDNALDNPPAPQPEKTETVQEALDWFFDYIENNE